jgi:hypothetical protein
VVKTRRLLATTARDRRTWPRTSLPRWPSATRR